MPLLLIDNDVPDDVVEVLRGAGHEVTRVREISELRDPADREVARYGPARHRRDLQPLRLGAMRCPAG